MKNFSRRAVLTGGGIALGLALSSGSRLALARGVSKRPLLVVILRGALDGLAAVPVFDDKYIRQYREQILPPPPGAPNGALALTDYFALHPSLVNVHKMYKAGEAGILHATAMPSGTRSHFAAQDFLETALYNARDGWLNRALQFLNPTAEAIGFGQSLPLILRGANRATSWAPSRLRGVNDDTKMRLMDLYASDTALYEAMSGAMALEDELDISMMSSKGKGRRSTVSELQMAARLLSKFASVVTLSIGGWDTHANQGAGKGILAKRLAGLDAGLATFKSAMGKKWEDTVILVMTEFGRTVRMNGTRGTDHGTAGVAFLLGGAVRGGKIFGDWPGLAPSELFENRDLPIANDLRSLIKGVLHNHWQIDVGDIDKTIFPGSKNLPIFW